MLFEDVGIDFGLVDDWLVFDGGLVEKGCGFVFYSDDWGGEGMIVVYLFGVFSGMFDVLCVIVEGCGFWYWFFVFGYVGWGLG